MVQADAEFSKYEQDLRKGVLVLAVLAELRTTRYGYSLRQALIERGMPIEEGTLYPLLRRLETQGLLESQWQVDGGPPRRYYSLSDRGAEMCRNLSSSWASLAAVMDRLLEGEPE